MTSDLTFIREVDSLRYYRYEPRLFRWYHAGYPEYAAPTASHQARMLIEYLQGGFHVIYMADATDEVLGYLVVAPGGRRLTCSAKEDIVLGPIWIRPSKRGQGLGTRGIHAVLHDLGETYRDAWEYIKTDNIASIRSVEKNGFTLMGHGVEKGPLRRVYPADEGADLIYRYHAE
ncbi:MAG: GNAT family N-acetyltransferase [Clostridia bacterium]|nr:GNAT family N-acetyltransferase [Clostridia bacterium]